MRRIELLSALHDQESTLAWCRQRGLMRSVEKCTECDNEMHEKKKACIDGYIWVCRKMIHGYRHYKKLSIRHGSIFEDSKLPIKTIVCILYEWARLTTVEECAFQSGLDKTTISRWYRRFRQIAEDNIRTTATQLNGSPDDIVEVDECQIGRRKHHRGRAPTAVWIVGGVVRGSNQSQLFIEIVRKRNAATLTDVLLRRVDRGATIVTDGWRGYRNLTEVGFIHKVVNHSVNFVDRNNSEIHTQNIENLWRCLRRFLHGRSNYSRRHLLSYIHEFIFRKSSVDCFETFLSILGRLNI